MTIIALRAFDGLRPAVSPTNLPDASATEALNVRLVGGRIEPLRGLSTVQALTKTAPATLYRYESPSGATQAWLEFLADTDVIRSPIADDPWGRVYWSDGTDVRYGPNSVVLTGASYPGASYKLGIPAPATAVTASGTAGAGATSETRVYVYTYVSAYGEEGPPSAASTPVTIDPTASVTVTGLATGPSGAYNVTSKRIYRSSVAAGGGVEYQFVVELPVANTSFNDTVSQANLGEVLSTEGFIPPPANLKGLRLLANGAAVGFISNTIVASEPNLPHAWPHRYPIDDAIVAIGVFGQSAAVLTIGNPRVLTGADPASMSMELLPVRQSCLSKRGVIETGNAVIYPSPDGLVSLSAGGIDNITSKLITKDQWQAYNPASMIGAIQDGRIHMFYTTTGGQRGVLIFDLTGQGAPFVRSNVGTSPTISAVYSDIRSDDLFLAAGTNIARFNAGSSLTGIWRSKEFLVPGRTSFSAADVEADTYPVVIRIYAGDALFFTKTVTSSEPFRLPGGSRHNKWQIEVESSTGIDRIRLAHAITELRASA